jgi:hypothetical protein
MQSEKAMPNYRRAFIPGGTWFFTVNLLLQTMALDSKRGFPAPYPTPNGGQK